MKSNSSHRCAVILGKGKYENERHGFELEDGPRKEFVEIAASMNAELISYTSASARRGLWFRKIFSKKPLYGSATDFAIQASNFDSCYVTGEDIALPLAVALKMRRWNGRMICVVHNITPRKARLFRLIGHSYFSTLIAVSKKQRDSLINECGMPAHKVIQVFNWVDTKFFRPSKSSIRGGRSIIMACGAENRDYDTLMKAAESVDADFEIFAHGFFNSPERLDRYGSSNVKQMPRVSFEELRASYQKADAVAVPLNDVNYAAGVTGLVEAMACGKPVVVTRTTGIEDYLEGIDANFQVEPANQTDMVRALKCILSESPDERACIGERHRAWVLENCDLDLYVKKICFLLGGYQHDPAQLSGTSV